MSDKPSGSEEQSVIVNQLIAEFMSRTDAGEELDAAQFVAEHPDHSDELKRHFANVDELEGLVQTDTPGTAETMLNPGDIAEESTDDATANTILRGNTDSETSVTRDHQQQNIGSKTNIDIPETFGRYDIQKVLGQGAMGAVYLAKDTQLDRDVALKIPKFDDSNGVDDEELLERFYREARASATLRSPNICPVFDVGEIDGQHYITMAYIEGRPLKDFTKSKKSHSEKQIITTIRKLATGLAEAHSIGVIHRDLKPANIMVDQKGEPVVMDFGLARRSASDDVQVTQSGAILGTPAYMAPEQVAGDQAAIDHQVDIYALGIIMYELITGEMPFKGNLMAILQQIALNNPTKPSEIRKKIDPRLESICLKMMEGDQANRYQSMTDVANDLQDVLRNPGKRQKKEEAKKTGPKPTSIPSAHEESNPALISVAQPKSFAAQLREKKGKSAKKPKSATKTKSGTKTTASTGSSSAGPPKRLLIAGGLGGLLLLLGIVFIVRLGKYDVQITLDDPSIQLSVDGVDLKELKITNGKDVYKLSAGKHKLQLKMNGLTTHVEEFTVTKDGETVLRAAIVNGKLDGLLNGEASTEYEVTEAITSSAIKSENKENFALQFDGIDDYVETNCQLDVKQPFTVEFLMRAGPTTQPITAIVNSMEATNNRPPGFSFYRRASDLMFSRNLDNQEPTIRAPNVLDRQQMSSVTGVWNGTELLLFIDGKKQETPIETNVLKTLSSPGSILLGAERHNGVPSWFFNGQLDEIRISNFARYDSNYKLESRFQPDAKTIALYHCDEGSGNILKDSSGNGHDGKVDGAKWVKAEGGTGTQEVASAFKSALRFDEDDRVEIPTLNFDGSHPVTSEARIHLSADPIFNESDGPATFDVATIGGLFGVNRTNWGHEAGWLASMTSKNQGPLHRKIVNEALSGHIAIVYDEKTVQLFFNGKPSENRMTQNNGEEQIDELPEIITYRMGTTLGKLPNIEWANSLQGDLSEIRISNIARYTEQYQPQVQLEDDEHTVALYHFDEGTGDILKDSSGNGHDGKIVGAKWVKADDITIRSAGADSQPLSLTGNNAFSIEEAEWSEPVNLGNIINTPGTEAGACLSADGLTLYFHSKRAGGMGDSDLWQAKRTSLDQSFGKPTNLGPLINSSATEQGPAISRDGLEMFFYSERPGGLGDLDIWQSKRSSLDAPFGKPINLGPLVNSAELDSHATISPDGKSLFFGSERPGGKGDSDFYIAVRESPDNEFGQAVHLPEISSTQGDFWARFTPDGNAIVFASYRQPKLGKAYLWITNRNRNGTFDDPVHLPGPMNTSHMQGAATFTPNGQQVIFDSARPGGQGGHDIWMYRRVTSDSSWKFDKNSGLSFSTPQARVEVSDFRFQDDRPVTLEAWVTKQKPDTAIVADWYGETRFNLSFTPEPNANYFGKQTKLFGPYPYAVKLNQRMHLAATWNGTSQMLFIDGRPVGNLNINDRSNSFQKQAVDMYIGGRPSSSGKQDWSGFPGVIHQVRISDGILYAGNAFTPEPVLGAGKSTLALYHFNEGAGDVHST